MWRLREKPNYCHAATRRQQRSACRKMCRQPKAVWAVAFACVVAFMGIGLVDPILKPIAEGLKIGLSADVTIAFAGAD
jgi:hypothetical protein